MITQPIHLFLGDDYMKGHRPTAEAAPYNASDSNRAIMRDINGGTLDTSFIRPAPIVANEWSIEHVLQQIANPGTWVVNVTPSNCKATFGNASWVALQEGGALVSSAENFMARCAVEPMFADLAPRLLFLVNGLGNFNAVTPRTAPYQVRPRGELERDGFTLHIVPSFASGAARNDLVLKLGGTNAYSIRLTLSGGASRLEVSVNSNVNSTGTFAHSALEELYVIVDWRRKRADVVRVATRQIAATVVLTNGNWSAQELIDATFGSFDGDISAPQSRPEYASPRVDLCVMQFAENANLADADVLKNGIGYMRTRPWGSGMPVWLILPPADLLGSGDKLTARAAMFQAARELDGVSVFETRHLARTTVSGRPVLTGASILDLATDLAHDARVLFTDRRRTMARPRRPGYERFADDASANEYIAQLIEAGAGTRELSPMLGGVGRRSGGGVDAPWVYGTTQRAEGDFHIDPNTAERLVPIDVLATQKGFSAPASNGVLLLPADTGTTVTSVSSPTLETQRLINYRTGLTTTPVKTRAQLYDPISSRIERTSEIGALRGVNLVGVTTWTPTGGSSTIGAAAPDGGTDASTMIDFSAGAVAAMRGPAIAATIGQPRWQIAFVKRETNPGCDWYCDIAIEESSVIVAGISLDPTNGRVVDIGSPSSRYVGYYNGWWLVAFRYTPGVTNPNMIIRPAAGLRASLGTPAVSAQGSIIAWGMPSVAASPGNGEMSSNLTPYAFTQQPRVLRSGGIYTEPTRTNLLAQTESLDAWTSSNATATRYDGRAPDGSPNAWALDDASAAAAGFISLATASLAVGSYVASCYVKKDTSKTNFVELRVSDGTHQDSVQLNTATGEIAQASFGTPYSEERARASLIINDKGDEWWRLELSYKSNGVAVQTVSIYPAATTVLGTVNASVLGSNIIASPQFEAGIKASSHIPTRGVTLIRNADEHSFVSAAIDSVFYDTGFWIDFFPAHASGSDQYGDDYLLELLTTPISLYITPDTTTTSKLVYKNASASYESDPFEYTEGDRLSIRVEYADEVRFFVNGAAIGAHDISADGDNTAYTGATARLGGTGGSGAEALGLIAEIRSL